MTAIQSVEQPRCLFNASPYYGHDRFILFDAPALSADLSRMRHPQRRSDPYGAHRLRAKALTDAVFPALAWMRDNHGVYIGDAPMLRAAFDLRWLEDLIERQVFTVYTNGILTPLVVEERFVPDIPEAVLIPVRRYIHSLPAYQQDRPISRQRRALFQQHGYAVLYFFPYLSVPRDHWNRRIAYSAVEPAVQRLH